jgi:hypothetical protein
MEEQAVLQADVLQLQQLSQAAQLVGRNVTYVADSSRAPVQGVVESVSVQNGQLQLHIGDDAVGLDGLIEVHEMADSTR